MSIMGFRLKWLFMIAALLIVGCDHSDPELPLPGVITLNWVAPSEYEDGSFLGLSNLDEFRIYVDQQLVAVVEPHLTSYLLELPAGNWAVSMSSVARGVESLPTHPVLIEIAEPQLTTGSACPRNQQC